MIKYNNRLYTLTYYVFNGLMHIYDLMCGTDYSFIDKSVKSNSREPYYATPVASLVNLRRYIKSDLDKGRGHDVLDIGCGKGFMLNFFSHMSFDTVSGIEYDKRLLSKARRNLYKSGVKARVNTYNGDAALFKKYQDYDVFYMYNPFDRNTLSCIIDRILDTLRYKSRPIYIIYCNPLYEDVLTDNGFVEIAHFYYKTKVFCYV